MGASTCIDCGTGLSIVRRVFGATRCGDCAKAAEAAEAARRAAQQSARERLEATLRQVAMDGQIASEEQRAINTIVDTGELQPGHVRELSHKIVGEIIDGAFGDDRLTVAELDQIDATASALGVPLAQFPEQLAHITLLRQLIEIENGNLPVLANPDILLKRSEVAHGATQAAYIEEKTFRERVGSSSAASFRIMKGVYYHRSLSRPRTVSTKRPVATDVGTLTVTNQRIVFTGTRKNFSARYTKVLGFDFAEDLIQINLENRVKPHIVQVEEPELMTALCAKAAELAVS